MLLLQQLLNMRAIKDTMMALVALVPNSMTNMTDRPLLYLLLLYGHCACKKFLTSIQPAKAYEDEY